MEAQSPKLEPTLASIDNATLLDIQSKLNILIEKLCVQTATTTLQEATTDDIEVKVDGELIVDTNENDVADTSETDVEETVSDDIVVDTAENVPPIDAPVDEFGVNHAFSSLIVSAIQDEYKTIQLYNDLIATANDQGMEDASRVLKHINEEELIHVGMLQTLLKQIDDTAKEIETGEDEAAEILNHEEDLTVDDTAIEA